MRSFRCLAYMAVALVPLVTFSGLSQEPTKPPAPEWKPFQEFNFLIGSWAGTAESGGRIGGRVGRFSMEMGGNYLVHRGNTIFTAQNQRPEESIEEIGYYYYDRDKRKYAAQYFYSTGIVGTYDVEFGADGSIRVLSNNLVNYDSGAKTRLSFKKSSDTEMTVQLDIAPAGKDYVGFLSSKMTKK